jgi:hypothetical protein
MDEPLNTENIEKTPLLKEKKPRPPQTEKQKEAFKKAREKLAERHTKIKETKILEAKRTLLEKEGYTKAEPKNESIQFKIDDSEESSDDVEPIKEIQKEKQKKQPKQETKALIKEEKKKPAKKEISRKPEPESESENEDSQDSDSSEEIVIIKRTKKNKKAQPKIRRSKSYDEEEEEDVEHLAPLTNYHNYFL